MHADQLLRHGAFLRRLATSLVRGDADADDVVQEAYLRALEHRPHRPRAWLAAVVRRLAMRTHRTRGRRARRERAAARPEALPDSGESVARLEVQRLVVDAVLDLPEPYRSTVVRRYFDGLSTREIAARTGVPHETVRTRLGRALRRLRGDLDGADGRWSLALAPLLLRAPTDPTTILGVTMMTAKNKILLVSLPLLGAAVGVAGFAALPDRPDGRGARSAASVSGPPADIAALQAQVRTLRREVEQLRAGGGADGSATATTRAGAVAAAGNPLRELLAIERGERQVAIQELFRRLVLRGDAVVPQVVAALRTGDDIDYGGGFSVLGNTVAAYPRLRTVLFDTLRQIGTPAAQRGLLDALGDMPDATDLRDVLMLFRTTTDARMVEGIAARVVALARTGEGRTALASVRPVGEWFRRHEFEGRTDALRELARHAFRSRERRSNAFGLLAATSPADAFEVARQACVEDPGLVPQVPRALLAVRVPLANVAAFYGLAFEKLSLDGPARASYYRAAPGRLCSAIEDAEARVEDGRALLSFLQGRTAAETDETARGALDAAIRRLRAALPAG